MTPVLVEAVRNISTAVEGKNDEGNMGNRGNKKIRKINAKKFNDSRISNQI